MQVLESEVDFAFKNCYSVSAELINGATEILRNYGKFFGGLDLSRQAILHWSGHFNLQSHDIPKGGLATSKGKVGGAGHLDHPQSLKLPVK